MFISGELNMAGLRVCCFVLCNLQNEIRFHITFHAKLEAANSSNNALPLYDKLAKIYGVDRAMGDKAETATEMRATKKASQPQCVDSIIEVDMSLLILSM